MISTYLLQVFPPPHAWKLLSNYESLQENNIKKYTNLVNKQVKAKNSKSFQVLRKNPDFIKLIK